jgi:hypothetical protein
MSPNFLVIGAMKSATTSLCDIFARHPQMFVSDPKEPEFFCKDEIYARGLPWYESLFAGAGDRSAVGEGSTSYTKQLMFPRAAERVARHLPEARLIYIARHPLERIESHWLHLIATGIEVPPLAEALAKWPHIVDTSLYWKQVEAFRRNFPDDRILVLFFEDFHADPGAAIARCYNFLGVDARLATAAPAEPSHVTSGMRLDGPLMRFLKRVPGARALKNLAPGLARDVMGRLRTPMPRRPQWPDELRRDVVLQLRDDTAQFLRHYGKSPDYWRLD